MRSRVRAALAVTTVALALPAGAQAATFTVTTTADSGAGSLRVAIDGSNAAPGANTITFDIPGSGVQTIQPTSALPTITVPVTIDGTSEPGYAGTPLIDLDGVSAGGASGLTVQAADTTVRGLEITGWSCMTVCGGIDLSGDDDVVADDFIGTDGTGALGNAFGVVIEDWTSSDVVGGATGAGDVISGNTEAGVFDESDDGAEILGDKIGTNAAGTSVLGNGDGVFVEYGVGTIIGSSADPNVISGNDANGILVVHSANTAIQGDLIGVSSGQAPLGNLGDGVQLTDDTTGTTVGGAAANVIADNGADGVQVQDGSSIGNSILSNAIFDNALGIDLADGGNGEPPAPVVSAATTLDATTTVTGTVATGTHRIQVFANASCADPEGEGLIADTTVTGTTWSVTVPVQAAGRGITATATDTTTADTTPFSACTPVVAQNALTVTRAGDADGTVSFTPTGSDCADTCTQDYASGTTITLSATPSAGATFVGWSGGGCSGVGQCTLTPTDDTTVQALFAAAPAATAPAATPPVATTSPVTPPSVTPTLLGVSDIGVSTDTIVWCAGGPYPSARLHFQLTRAAPVRLVLLTRGRHGYQPVGTALIDGRAGLNQPRIAGRWHGQLVRSGPVRLEIQLRGDGHWATVGTIALAVRHRA